MLYKFYPSKYIKFSSFDNPYFFFNNFSYRIAFIFGEPFIQAWLFFETVILEQISEVPSYSIWLQIFDSIQLFLLLSGFFMQTCVFILDGFTKSLKHFSFESI